MTIYSVSVLQTLCIFPSIPPTPSEPFGLDSALGVISKIIALQAIESVGVIGRYGTTASSVVANALGFKG